MAVDNATVNLYINKEQAEGAIAELEKSYQKLKAARIAADKAGNSQESLELQAQEYSALQKLKDSKHGVLDIEKAMANLNVVNLRQLAEVKRKLTNQMRELNQDTDEYKTKLEQLQRVENQIAKARGKNNAEQKGFMASLKGAWNNIMPVAGFAGIFITAGNFIKSLVADVWDLTKTIQGDSKRAAQVFGDELGYVELQASKLSKQMGVTNREFVSMTTGVADLLIPLDFSRERAAKMAVEVQKLSGALNEWTSGKYGVEEVSNRLTKAMLGETEGLKQLGIAIRLDSEEYKDLIKQKENEGAASTAQAQALAILDLLYKKSADAQAAYNSSGNELLRFQNSASRGWRAMIESMAEWFAMTKAERVEKLARTYQALNDEFNRNESALDRLMPIYAELSTKTNLNENEQQQLRAAIDGIVQIIPHAATGFDAYGRALGVNTAAVNTAREAQRLLNIEMKKDLSEDLFENIESQINDAEHYNRKKKRLSENIKLPSKGFRRDIKDPTAYKDNMNDRIVEQIKLEQQAYDQAIKHMLMLEAIGYTRDEINEKIITELDIEDLSLSKINLAYEQRVNAIKAASDAKTKAAEDEAKRKAAEDEANSGLIPKIQKQIATAKTELNKLKDQKAISEKSAEISNLEAELRRLQSLGAEPDNQPKSWNLESDMEFGAKRLLLKKQLLDGELSTEQEYSRLLLDLEISTLEARLATNREKGDELARLHESLTDRKITRERSERDRLSKLLEVTAGGKSDTEKENASYERRLRDLGLFSRSRETLTRTELDALLVLERNHARALSGIYTKALSDQIASSATALERRVNLMKISQAGELSLAVTLEQKKQLLQSRFSYENLSQIRTSRDADRALTAEYASEQESALRAELTGLIDIYKGFMGEASALNPFGALVSMALSPEDRAALDKAIAELEAKLAALGQKPKSSDGEDKNGKNGDRVDILGMRSDDWKELLDNLKAGELSLENIEDLAGAIGTAFSQVSDLMSALEQREFREYEKSQNAKKRSLDRRLAAGLISQEQFSAESAQIDDDLETKRQEMERKQAERAQMLAVFQAIVNTALAVTSALTSVPFGPWNIALASAIGILGAVQIATILATPLPGAEDGGYINVTRAQDGKPFRARLARERGYHDKPTALVGESGRELVIPNDGLQNPTLAPFADIIAASIARGDIRSLNFPEALARRNIPGYSTGGYSYDSPSARPGDLANVPSDYARSGNRSDYSAGGADSGLTPELLAELTAAIDRLVDTPLEAYVRLHGPGGLAESWDRYRRNASRSSHV